MEGSGLPGKLVVQRAMVPSLRGARGPGPTRANRAGVVLAHIYSLHALWYAAINKKEAPLAELV